MIWKLFISTFNITIVTIIEKSKYQRNEEKNKNVTKWRNKTHTNKKNWVNSRVKKERKKIEYGTKITQ